ncbi:MAG: hypothetical protein KGQ89_06030 [Verrucomicrobia bacterium]|nr:hypothetical protein [Verrucomicrobiota bacterium]
MKNSQRYYRSNAEQLSAYLLISHAEREAGQIPLDCLFCNKPRPMNPIFLVIQPAGTTLHPSMPELSSVKSRRAKTTGSSPISKSLPKDDSNKTPRMGRPGTQSKN